MHTMMHHLGATVAVRPTDLAPPLGTIVHGHADALLHPNVLPTAPAASASPNTHAVATVAIPVQTAIIRQFMRSICSHH
jgi:hypothetical protein